MRIKRIPALFPMQMEKLQEGTHTTMGLFYQTLSTILMERVQEVTVSRIWEVWCCRQDFHSFIKFSKDVHWALVDFEQNFSNLATFKTHVAWEF